MSPIKKLPTFDMLVALHKQNPDAYEEFRRDLLRSCIDEAPESHQPGLELLYQRIETVRATARAPLEAAASASRLMIDSCLTLRQALGDLVDATAAMQTVLILEKFRH